MKLTAKKKRKIKVLKPEYEEPNSPRTQLLKFATDPKLSKKFHIRQDVPYTEQLKGQVNSRFCFQPRGKSAWSSRLFRVLYQKCIPVILNDDYEPPLQDLFGEGNMISDVPTTPNWQIRWPMRKVNSEFAKILEEIPVDVLHRMLGNAQPLHCWYSWPPGHLDSGYAELIRGNYTKKVCSDWRTKNAYLQVTKMLLRKKRLLYGRGGSGYQTGIFGLPSSFFRKTQFSQKILLINV